MSGSTSAASKATSTPFAVATATNAAPTSSPIYNLVGVNSAGPTSSGGLAGTGAIYNLPTGTQPFAYPALPSGGAGGPNDPNFNQGQNTAGGGSGSSSNLGLIVGVTVAGVVVIAMAGLLLQRYRSRSRTNTLNSHQTRSRNKNNHQTPRDNSASAQAAGGYINGGEEERGGDRAKLARSFTIRKPPSVYIEDDQDLDQTGHPRYKSASDAMNHPYYGDHRTPGLVEYELSDTSGQKYGPSSVAERKRYVEQQQRKVMDEYEMFNPHMDAPPTSPYPPSHLTSAPSYTSAATVTPGPLSPTMAPSMGGRSPRVQHHPSQSPSPSPFGRSMHHDSNDYQY
ncbi:hypothetical protein BGX28_000368 [Mortierella sp. GBA30]|nr:hypothetical protein BGX28_000368 [Mortierella sp. GBA30]